MRDLMRILENKNSLKAFIVDDLVHQSSIYTVTCAGYSRQISEETTRLVLR